MTECLAALALSPWFRNIYASTQPEALAGLKQSLSSLAAEERVRLLKRFLDSRSDAPTSAEFKVGANGFLQSAPTLRTWALDYLAQTDPASAAQYAQELLQGDKQSADEWALAMRSYARVKGMPEDKAFLREKFQEMVRFVPWRSDPSVGFLEAFDVPVYLHATELVPVLGQLTTDRENRAAGHAAYLALDRLTISDPAATLGQLLAQPDLMKGREVTRANFFARADVSDPAQRELVENYLKQSTGAELATFAGLYPNANYMVSHNLLTSTSTPDHETLARQDRQALAVVEQWLGDPRFEKLKPQLQSIKNRLDGFVKQAAAR